MGKGSGIIIEFGQRTLRAMRYTSRGETLHVDATLVKALSDEVDADDTAAVGQWIGQTLRDNGFARDRAMWVLSRERVGVKRLTLPSADADELPEMVRLSMQRDLPFDAEDAMIDFVPLGSEGESTSVLAIAAPFSAIAQTKAIAKESGFGIDRITLRSMGTATLIAELGEPAEQATLAIDVRATIVDFNVIIDGAIRFSRATELPGGDDPDLIAEAVITETRRTWMSYRVAEGAIDVQQAYIFGERELTQLCIEPMREVLNRPIDIFSAHPRVDCNGSTMPGFWPLAGLAMKAMRNQAMINFAAPRQAPDFAARRRTRVLAVAALAIIVLLGVWTVARHDLGTLQDRVDRLTEQRNRMTPDYMRFTRDVLKAEHIEQWEQVHVNWIAHLQFLHELAPDPKRIVLDEWNASLSFRGAVWERNRPADERWSTPAEVLLIVSGEAIDRPTADALRDALVRSDVYTTNSTGSDQPGGRRLPYGFDYRLRTTLNRLREHAGDGLRDGVALVQQPGESMP